MHAPKWRAVVAAIGGLAASGATAAATPATRPQTASRPSCIAGSDSPPSAWWFDAALAGNTLHICLSERHQRDDGKDTIDHRCVGLDPASGELLAVANQKPARPPEPTGSLVKRDGKLTTCAADGACRPVSKQLARALHKTAADNVEREPHGAISADGTLAVVGNQIWNIAKDRRLGRLAPPPMDSMYRDYGDYGFEGNVIVGEWVPCAGPCNTSRIYRRDGKVIVGALSATTSVLHLRDGGLAVLTNGSYASQDGTGDKLEIYDTKRARRVRTIDVLPPGFERLETDVAIEGKVSDPLVQLEDDTVAVLVRNDQTLAIAMVDIDHGRVTRRFQIPVCARPH